MIFTLAVASLATAASPRPVTVRANVAHADRDSTVMLWTFDLADRWHLYGPHRNDTGQPPVVQLDLPDGWSASPLRGWPWPQRQVVADLILDHVYEDQLVLWQSVVHPAGAPAHDLRASLRWLVCSDLCVPGDTTLTISIPAPMDARAATGLAHLRAAAPAPLPEGLITVTLHHDGVEVRAPGAQHLAFVPDADGPELTDLLRDGVADGDRLFLRTAAPTAPDHPLTGLLSIHHNSGTTTGTVNLTRANQGE